MLCALSTREKEYLKINQLMIRLSYKIKMLKDGLSLLTKNSRISKDIKMTLVNLLQEELVST